MKYSKFLTGLAIMALLPVAAGWGSSDSRSLGYAGGVNSNPHNLSRQSGNTIEAANNGDPYETQICVFCHTPHGATPQTTLWNRPVPNRMGSFPLFDTVTPGVVKDTSGNFGIDDVGIVDTTKYKLNGVDGVEYPNGATKLCLSCHDGVTAIGTLANGTTIQMTASNLKAGGSAMFWDPVLNDGKDFSRTHPVSFVYTDAVAAHLNGAGGKAEGYVATVPTAILDSQSRMQCTTCHDPHLDTRVGAYTLPFWRNNTSDDVLDYDNTCAACHTVNPGGVGNRPAMHNI